MKESYGPDSQDLTPDESDLNPLEALMRKIPGFKGYFEKSDRRQADQLLRETIAARFEQVRLEFSTVHETLAKDIIKAIDFAEPLGRIDNGLMGLIGKIKDAPQGYSSFFDATKVDAEKLDELYAFDQTMMGHGEQIVGDVQALQSAIDADSEVSEAISRLGESVKVANSAFASRTEILTNMA